MNDVYEAVAAVAVEQGWCQNVYHAGVEAGLMSPVVVVVVANTPTLATPLGELIDEALAELDDIPPEMLEVMEAAGCPPFVVFPIECVELCQGVQPEIAESVRENLPATPAAELQAQAAITGEPDRYNTIPFVVLDEAGGMVGQATRVEDEL